MYIEKKKSQCYYGYQSFLGSRTAVHYTWKKNPFPPHFFKYNQIELSEVLLICMN